MPDGVRLAARSGRLGDLPLPSDNPRNSRWRRGFHDFLSRQGTPAVIDVVVGTIVLLLVLEACRRTTGLALPIVCLALGYAYYGGYLPQGAAIAHAGVNWDQIISASFIQATGIYGVPLDVAATFIVLFAIYGAVLDAVGGEQVFHRSVARGVSPVAGGTRPNRHARRVPARLRLRIGHGNHCQPGLGHVADSSPSGLSEGECRRNAGRRRHRRDSVPADAGRGRVHHRGVSRRSLPDRAGLGDRTDDPSTTSASCWRSRSTPAGTARAKSKSASSRAGGCSPGSVTT